MNLLKYDRNQIVALVKDGIATVESIHHWDICKALAGGKTAEQVAEDFKMHVRSIEYVRTKKCQACP